MIKRFNSQLKKERKQHRIRKWKKYSINLKEKGYGVCTRSARVRQAKIAAEDKIDE
jgi:hypothetical protein